MHTDSQADITPRETAADSIDREELIAALRELLAAERAGARTAAACLAQAHTATLQSQLSQLHRQEVSSCRALLHCLQHLDAKPGQAVGDFYQKVMALDTFQERMELIDAGQRWVLRRVERLLPRVHDSIIAHHLETVRHYHAPGSKAASSGSKEP